MESLSQQCSVDPDPQFFPSRPMWTPEIARVAAIVATWIANDMPGGHILGLQRSGKSSFAEYLRQSVTTMLGASTVVVMFSLLGQSPKTASDVLRIFLSQLGIKAITNRDQAVLQGRLIDSILRRCNSPSSRRLLLIVDEMQNLPDSQHGVLMGIGHSLIIADFQPCIVSIGQPEMQRSIDLLYKQDALQIIGRLFPVVELFRGLEPLEVIEFIKAFEGEDQAFTKKWFPRRAENGFGLEDLCVTMTTAISELQRKLNISGVILFPMGYLRPTLNSLFRSILEKDREGDLLWLPKPNEILACIQSSGFTSVARHYVRVPAR